jgi:hypothetical protein
LALIGHERAIVWVPVTCGADGERDLQEIVDTFEIFESER